MLRAEHRTARGAHSKAAFPQATGAQLTRSESKHFLCPGIELSCTRVDA